MNSDYSETLQKQLEQSFLFAPFLGINLTIFAEKLGEWHGTAGYQNPQTREALDLHRIFYIYSITKTFTAVVILKLVENGNLSLDESASQYIYNLDIPRSISLRQLLNHTSGLPNYTELEDYIGSLAATPDRPLEEQQLADLLQAKLLDFASGEGWHYSNTGYFMLKKIIENCCGLSYADAIDEHIIKPLELTSTFVVEAMGNSRLTPGYSRELHPENWMENITAKYHPGWCYTGLIASSTKDTVKFYRELFAGNLLSEKAIAELSTPISIKQKDSRFGNPCYGLGIMIDTRSKYGVLMGHGGHGPGYNSWAMHLPDFHNRPVTIAAFSNTSVGTIPLLLIDDLLSHLVDT